MVMEKLNNLALLYYIRLDIVSNVDNIIEKFANQGQYRLEFILQLKQLYLNIK